VTLDDKAQARLWNELASTDAARAWQARTRLASAPRDAVSLLSKRLKPTAAKTMKELAELDDDDFDVRQIATKRLAEALKSGDRAVEQGLRELLEKPPSLEAQLRARKLLTSAGPKPYAAEELRIIRAVGVLGQIGSDESKALLKRLAKGGPSLLTAEARAALAPLEGE